MGSLGMVVIEVASIINCSTLVVVQQIVGTVGLAKSSQQYLVGIRPRTLG